MDKENKEKKPIDLGEVKDGETVLFNLNEKNEWDAFKLSEDSTKDAAEKSNNQNSN